ncbi:helix-turn-helix transcriptional regulator [Myroides phaeus]|uniref:Predicted DNA-binding transcriptional regulator YafY, contains an HTH and WYL domains n=1 Tax=Myroides phaeus TaxID=702745 RepID=A0A1G8GC49_9FLAO|nr:WYL domain-containing protein [Myroides phaeus]SDH91944.1 Predicted DNA-binding transcriptional regulator YafY, contains an HTH and WYL domains [Myroides phaeus]
MKKLRYYFLVLNYLKQNQFPSRELLLDYLKEFDIDISERTLYRALKELKSEFGIFIKLDTKKKGYYIAEDAEDNANTVLTYLKGIVTADILNSANKSKFELSHFIDRETKGSLVSIDCFRIFFKAMTSFRKISFKYDNQVKVITLSPLFFKQYRGHWYVIGYEGKDLISFELNKTSEAIILKDKFKANGGLIKDTYKEIVGFDYTDSDLEQVVLSLCTSQESSIRKSPLHCSQTLNNCAEDGRLLVTLRVRPNNELKKEILKYGKFVKVVHPEHLKHDIISELRSALELNA